MAYIRKVSRKKGMVFKAEVLLGDGSKRSRAFRTREEAKAWSRGQEDMKSNQKSFGITPVRMSFAEFFQKFYEEYAMVHHSEGWRTTDLMMFEKYMNPILGRKLLRDIHPVDIQRVLQKMLNLGLAKSYANRVRVLMHKVFNEAVKTYRYLSFNPVSAVKPFKEEPYDAPHMKTKDAAALLKWADGHPFGIGIHLALQLGLREGEILGLKWDALDLEERHLTIKRKWNKKIKKLEEFAKGGKHRYLGIYPDGLLERLKLQRSRYPHSEFVVCKPDGQMISDGQLIHALRTGIGACQLPWMTVHGLRHSFATIYMQNGGDLYDLQLLMGHQSAKTTERYRHRDPEYMRSRCNVFSLYDEDRSTQVSSAQTPPRAEKVVLRLVSGESVSV